MSTITNIITYLGNYTIKSITNKLFDDSISSIMFNLINIVVITRNLNNKDFNKFIIDLDLDFKLELIQNFLSDMGIICININQDDNQIILSGNKETELEIITTKLPSQYNNQFKSLSSAIKYLCITLNNIHNLMTNINQKIEYHNTKYFNSLRKLDIEFEMNLIKKEHNILLGRFDLILKIFNCLR